MSMDARASSKQQSSEISGGLRTAGAVFRAIFMVSLMLVTLRVSMPQSETIWTAYETPGDLIRVALGVVVCVAIAVRLFMAPKDNHAYRTWFYLGLVAVPFAVICVFAVWRSILFAG